MFGPGVSTSPNSTAATPSTAVISITLPILVERKHRVAVHLSVAGLSTGANDEQWPRSRRTLRTMADDRRFTWMAEVMGVRPTDLILEIGPGSSKSIAYLAARATDGRVVGIDRSATAIQRASKTHAALIDSGQVRLAQTGLADLDPAQFLAEHACGAAGFDKILAVNVNVFWTKRPLAELALLRRLLAPAGTLHLFYGYGTPEAESSSPKPAPGKLRDYLADAGFGVHVVTAGDLLGILATRA
ncbi:methyltransferase [Nocardia brasiliensis]|uniref:Putative methyltransferase n=2 Tax=Nocardia brasiliensis TaxID=37326 RepID=K0ESJ9_NOCB7|nr:putative methyltransferase [Nocardia brasiliensis ATCC 700358]OCF88950.1 methyltransferase [Nocardia brasiliensis]